mmetsp:Transcript_17268/g.65844  ORF Transcript_17268/g.65844 Transcript_17268/m.65844 type:complete len:223 (+) Transcript_17268:241-909(+)
MGSASGSSSASGSGSATEAPTDTDTCTPFSGRSAIVKKDLACCAFGSKIAMKQCSMLLPSAASRSASSRSFSFTSNKVPPSAALCITNVLAISTASAPAPAPASAPLSWSGGFSSAASDAPLPSALGTSALVRLAFEGRYSNQSCSMASLSCLAEKSIRSIQSEALTRRVPFLLLPTDTTLSSSPSHGNPTFSPSRSLRRCSSCSGWSLSKLSTQRPLGWKL